MSSGLTNRIHPPKRKRPEAVQTQSPPPRVSQLGDGARWMGGRMDGFRLVPWFNFQR